jgi:hypothetical protein
LSAPPCTPHVHAQHDHARRLSFGWPEILDELIGPSSMNICNNIGIISSRHGSQQIQVVPRC